MLTIGHSTLPGNIFRDALRENGVDLLIDVRTISKSRHNPQFGMEELSASIQAAAIEYRWMPQLGGLRRSGKDSINTGWRNTGFRGYADYMQTEDFVKALAELIAIDQQATVAIMCSEAVPWRCHRSLIGDALLAHNRPVEDIFVSPGGGTYRKPHKLTSFARVEGTRVWYPVDPGQEELPLV